MGRRCAGKGRHASVLFKITEGDGRMRHRVKAYCLLVVSILMLAAAVYPHHHHENRFCFHASLEDCTAPLSTDSGKHYPGDADNHACGAACVTQFSFSFQQIRAADVSPDYSFCFFIHALPVVLKCLDEVELPAVHTFYIEKLHALQGVAARSLRAPPFC